jgi:hypothetical protein
MTVKIDGTNGLLQSYDYQVLTTGFSYTFAAGTQVLVAVPAGTLATGTVTMPSAPADGMVITIQSSQQITALTLNGNTGQSLVGTAVQISPNAPLSWVYRLTNTTWYPFAGVAGRASSLVTGAAVASTSGTSIDYTSIPSWVKRITVMYNGVSTNGSSNYLLQIGSGSVSTSGYNSVCSRAYTPGGPSTHSSTAGFLSAGDNAGFVWYGTLVLTLQNTNTWVCQGSIGQYATSPLMTITTVGQIALGGALDRVRITTTSGTDTFDAGSVNILYE